jgi:NAD(P)-dependent dehydrogenase (short-subunit alcohol dehydrogenase family)
MMADQSKPADVRKVFAKAKQTGGLDAVIVNAGLSVDGLVEVDDEEWRYGVETNLVGYLDVANRAAEAFEGKSGDIISIGSVSAEKRSKGTSVYTATKAGIQGSPTASARKWARRASASA